MSPGDTEVGAGSSVRSTATAATVAALVACCAIAAAVRPHATVAQGAGDPYGAALARQALRALDGVPAIEVLAGRGRGRAIVTLRHGRPVAILQERRYRAGRFRQLASREGTWTQVPGTECWTVEPPLRDTSEALPIDLGRTRFGSPRRSGPRTLVRASETDRRGRVSVVELVFDSATRALVAKRYADSPAFPGGLTLRLRALQAAPAPPSTKPRCAR